MTTLEQQIEKLKADAASALESQINQLKLDNEFVTAKKEFQTKQANDLKAFTKAQADEVKEFETKYGQNLEPTPTKPKLSIDDKVVILRKKGYTVVDGVVTNKDGAAVTSTLVFKDNQGNKQTLKASSFVSNY